MGTDIHFYVEKKTDGVWKMVFPEALIQIRDEVEDYASDPERKALFERFPGKWVDTYEEWEKVRGPYEERRTNPFVLGRNYNLFAILADVRNGRGFAGVKTGEGFNVIVEPRGIPVDASADYLWEAEYQDGDGHSHSWLTLRELTGFDWEQTTALSGWVGPYGYREFKEKGSPSSWCGLVSGRDIKLISNEEMDTYIQNTEPSKDKDDFQARVYTHVEWGVSYRECAGKFLKETLPALQQLGDPDDVRICFFFDN